MPTGWLSDLNFKQPSQSPIVIARSESDEAIQIVPAKPIWIASLRSQSRLYMHVRILAARSARGFARTTPENTRAQETPGARCTRSLACESDKAHEIVTTGSPSSPAFPAQWFYGLFRALPGDRALLPPSPASHYLQAWRQRRGVRTTRLCRPP